MSGAKDWAWMLIVGMALGATAHAAKIYSFTGKVSQISGNEVQVTRGLVVREFSVSGMSMDQRDVLKVGEEVTLWYTMEAQSATRQQAGRAGNLKNDAQPQDSQDNENEPLPPNIQDDRAFYNAKIDLKPDPSQGV